MEIQVSKLRELMELFKPVIPKKTTLPIIRYIRLGEGKAYATDLESMVIADLPEAMEPMLIPYASLAGMLKYVPGNESLTIEAKDKQLTLTWSGGKANYPTESVEDYPILPEMPVRAEAELDGDTLIAAMMAALPYTATETARPILSGITVVLGNPVEVAAGDGFRMSHQALGLSFPLEVKIIVPAHAVAILGHVFAKTPRTPPMNSDSLIPVITAKRQLHISLAGDNKLMVDFGKTASVIISLISGTPPEWLNLIPKEEPVLQSQIFAPQFEAAIRRVRAVAKDGSDIIRMIFDKGTLTVSAKGEDQEISATLDTLNTKGEPGRTAINLTYLLDFLSGKQGIIILSQYDKTSPVAFQYQNSPRVLIMPMFVQWGDEKPTAAEKVEPEPETIEENLEVESEEELEPSLEAQAAEAEEKPEPVAATPTETPAKRTRKRKTS